MEMSVDFSRIFHQSSKDRSKGHPPISLCSEDWPDEWRTHQYKQYVRFQKQNLGEPAHMQADLFNLIKERRSQREGSGKALSLGELSILLKFSCGIVGAQESSLPRRAQPSAGARYPIEVYPFVLMPGDVSGGIYHYDVRGHILEVLREKSFLPEEIALFFPHQWIQGMSLALVMTAVFERNQMKYGERGYRYMLIEAGHIGQNVCLLAEALGLQCCAVGGSNDEAIERSIGIDGRTESVVYTLVLGK